MISRQQLLNIRENPYPCIINNGQGNVLLAHSDAEQIASQITNPNRIEIVEPEKEKKSISIEQAREFRKRVTLKSQHTTHRVFIFKDISLMGGDAQNTLLKTLEELGANNTVLLPVANTNDILPTIISRSSVVTSTIKLNNRLDKKQFLIDSAIIGYKNATPLTEFDLVNAVEFMRYSVSDRLHHFKDVTENREKLITLLQSLRVLCISTMRETTQHEAKLAWSKKVTEITDILKKAESNTSAKLLLLGAATRL